MEPRMTNCKGEVNKLGQGKNGLYFGNTTVSGSGTNLPAGWTVSTPTANAITVTHNLGLSAYTVVASLLGATTGGVNVTTLGANAFVVTGFDSAGAGADRAFTFAMSVGNNNPTE